ncbi:DUF3793 family protein [Lachnospiraceae bacterium 62-35]
MSEEAFQIIMNMDMDEIRTHIAFHCAPLLAGLKMSNLLTVSKTQGKCVLKIFYQTGISCHVLWESGDKTTFLLYHRRGLEEYLECQEVKILMERLGYVHMGQDEILKGVSTRYRAHMEERAQFPHEIGILLGYPVEDVAGFMDNQGKNFLCAGYWKVYGNPMEAVRTFRLYDKAQAAVMVMVRQGRNIREILQICRKISFS